MKSWQSKPSSSNLSHKREHRSTPRSRAPLADKREAGKWSSESRSAARVHLLSGLFGNKEGKKMLVLTGQKPQQEMVTKCGSQSASKSCATSNRKLPAPLPNVRDGAKLQHKCSGARESNLHVFFHLRWAPAAVRLVCRRSHQQTRARGYANAVHTRWRWLTPALLPFSTPLLAFAAHRPLSSISLKRRERLAKAAANITVCFSDWNPIYF